MISHFTLCLQLRRSATGVDYKAHEMMLSCVSERLMKSQERVLHEKKSTRSLCKNSSTKSVVEGNQQHKHQHNRDMINYELVESDMITFSLSLFRDILTGDQKVQRKKNMDGDEWNME
jgi:hypothetical protein